MIGEIELARWPERAAWGVREWRRGMEGAGALVGCLAGQDPLLPHIDIAALVDPLAAAGFTVPADEEARAERRSAGSRRGVANRTPPPDAMRRIETRHVPETASWPMPPHSERAAEMPPVTNERVSNLLTMLARVESNGAPEPLTRPATPQRFRSQMDGSAAQIHQNPPPVRPAQYHYSIEPRSPVLSQRGAPAYFTSSNSRVTELLRHLTSAPERHIDVERSEPVTPPPPQPPPALLEATTNAAWTTLIESAAAVAKPEVLTDAVERLAHTVDSIGERLRSTAPAPPPSETEPEIRWIADDELAGRLHAILKRQAHARGIDLS